MLFQDLTEIKALKSEPAQERLAAIGELQRLAYELRNPLASILGCVQIQRRGSCPLHERTGVGDFKPRI